MADMHDYEIIHQKFELDVEDELTEEQLIIMLAKRISEMLDLNPELLFSTLYRLDVYESKINQVLRSGEDPALGLATLVMDRQKQKLKTKQEYRNKGGDEGFIDV